jgi:serine/threonine protein kinase/TolB-like protein/tetratricopeptide (TPR) repeat protein
VSSARWRQIKEIVDAALDQDPSDRARFLDRACPDQEIRKEVDSLLVHEAEGFLEEPPPAVSAKRDTSEATTRRARSEELVGSVLSHYVVQKKLGHGGMGDVFLAQDRRLDRRVALKLLAEGLEKDETARRRFMQEARSAAALDHPYICKIYEIGEVKGKSFLAMEYIGGETLADRLKGRSLPLAETLRIALEIAEALETAHRERIVHRDLKPANIMLTVGGHVKVLDFGLAKRLEPQGAVDSQFETASRLTGDGLTLGTIAYMAPEQIRGQAVDARWDVFSFGIVLHEMLSGAHPFARSTSVETAAAILNLPAPPMADVPEPLERIINKMLAKEPDGRYQNVHEVRTDLERVAEQPRLSEEPSASRQPAASGPGRRHVGWAALALGALVAAIAVWRSGPFAPSVEGPPSVAVLPMTNISEDPLESDYLADGICQAVTTKLTQVGLRVTPWETARRYRDRGNSADAIARELNVDAVLTGTFQISGNQILTNVSLVDAHTGFQSWADIIVEPHEDIFQMQLRIATGVASSLKQVLSGEEEQALAVPESRSVDAYDFYLQGAYFMKEGTEEATKVALDYFTRAIDLDPNLAEAYVGTGAVHDARYWYFWGGGATNLDRAEASYERALRLDPASMRAHRGLIMVYTYRGRHEAALAQGQLARRAGRPDDVETLLARAEAYHYAGLIDRSLPLYRRVLEIDPANDAAHWHLAVAFSFGGAYEDAIRAGDVYFSRFGDDALLHDQVARAHHALGHPERARQHYEKATAVSYPVAFFGLGLLFEQLGERERAEEAWRRGVELLAPRLKASPDDPHTATYLACFYGLLGERSPFLALKRTLVATGYSFDGFWDLAAVEARVDGTERAVELMRAAVRKGTFSPRWERSFDIAAISLPASEAMDAFRQECEADDRRLRDLY